MRWIGTSLVVSMALTSEPAFGQPDPSARGQAQELFDLGARQIEVGEWEAGCRSLERSVRLHPTPGAYVNLGVCSEERGHFHEAAERYRRALSLSPGWSRAIEALERLPKVTLVVSPEVDGLVVQIDGEPVPLGEHIVDRGKHELTAEAPGHKRVSASFEMADGSLSVGLSLTPLRDVTPPIADVPTAKANEAEGSSFSPSSNGAPPDSSPRPTRQTRGEDWDDWGYAALIVGAAGLAAGASLGFFALEKVDASDPHCRLPGGTCDAEGVRLRAQASDFQWAGLIAAGVGLASASVGAWILLSPETPDGQGVAISLGGRY